MNEKINRLFYFNPAPVKSQDIKTLDRTTASKTAVYFTPKFDAPFSGQTVSITPSSIDSRIEDALRPVIRDESILIPQKFHALLEETQTALLNEAQADRPPEVTESLKTLISLLREHTDLIKLFDSYVNWLQKTERAQTIILFKNFLAL